MARVLDRGTATRSADVIADDLDGRGASLSVSAGRHQIGVAAACLVEDLLAGDADCGRRAARAGVPGSRTSRRGGPKFSPRFARKMTTRPRWP